MNSKLFIPLLITLIMGTGFHGCTENEIEPADPSAVSFLALSDSLDHTVDSLVVYVELNRRAGVDGHISVRLTGNAVHGRDFTARPEAVNGVITLEILKEMQTAHFTLFRSGLYQTDKNINLNLENPTEGFILGNQVSSSVKLLKHFVDSVNFSDVFIHISEFEINGYEIELNLSGSITHTEQVTIEIINPEGSLYGTHFNTNPAAVNNELVLDVVPGTKKLSFKIIPVNDNIMRGTYEVLFRISGATGRLHKGTFNELIVRVEEDDNNVAVIHTIAELKNKFSEHTGEFWIGDDYLIEGIITSGSNVANNKTAYLQDATGGIMLMFTIQNYLKMGDKVKINLKGGSGNNINGQKAIFGIRDMLGIKVAENQVILPEVITLEQLATGNYEGKRVRINSVSFLNANGTNTFKGHWPITSGTSGAIVTTYPAAPFSNNILPQGSLSVSGIVGDWGRVLPQVYNQDIIQ